MGVPGPTPFSNVPNKKTDAPNKKRGVGIPVYDNRIQRSCDDGIRLRSAAAGRSKRWAPTIPAAPAVRGCSV